MKKTKGRSKSERADAAVEADVVRGASAGAGVTGVSAMGAGAAAPEEITIRAEPIELTQLLKFAGVFDSGGEAKHAINAGQVTVNGAVESAARKQIFAGQTVVCGGRTLLVRL